MEDINAESIAQETAGLLNHLKETGWGDKLTLIEKMTIFKSAASIMDNTMAANIFAIHTAKILGS